MSRRVVTAAALGAATLAGCGGAAAPASHAPGRLTVQRAVLAPGRIGLIVHNGTRTPARLAQVAIDSGFVPFDGPATAVPPASTVRLTIAYPWEPGEGYTVKVLTAVGDTLSYRIAAQR